MHDLLIYQVGGSVRDALLHLPVVEKDWVVVGATPQQMLDLGFKQVGKDFPVFLHPDTHEEYALARTERKTGPGHKGFVCHAKQSVTLEEDLQRRDLTINAMALSQTGQLIDPYGGLQDLKNKCFRHVSEAFAEDPLRVLRVARFSARFTDFHIHASTLSMMKQMSQSGELCSLAAERIWKEYARALPYDINRFFYVLSSVDAIGALFPAFDFSLITRENGQDWRLDGITDRLYRHAALMWCCKCPLSFFSPAEPKSWKIACRLFNGAMNLDLSCALSCWRFIQSNRLLHLDAMPEGLYQALDHFEADTHDHHNNQSPVLGFKSRGIKALHRHIKRHAVQNGVSDPLMIHQSYLDWIQTGIDLGWRQ